MLIFLHSSRVMGLVLHSLVDLPISIFNPIFSLQKGERLIFTFIYFLKICLDHLIIFLYGAWVESESEIFCYRWSIDLMTVLFFTPHSFFGSLIEIIQSHLYPSHNGHFYDLRVSVIFPVLDFHHMTIYHMICCTFDLGHLFICTLWS